MNKDLSALNIRDMAISLGFESCGIIKLETLRKYAKLEENYDWAKSVIVCVTQYGKYSVPEGLEGLIGKYCLYDHKP